MGQAEHRRSTERERERYTAEPPNMVSAGQDSIYVAREGNSEPWKQRGDVADCEKPESVHMLNGLNVGSKSSMSGRLH